MEILNPRVWRSWSLSSWFVEINFTSKVPLAVEVRKTNQSTNAHTVCCSGLKIETQTVRTQDAKLAKTVITDRLRVHICRMEPKSSQIVHMS